MISNLKKSLGRGIDSIDDWELPSTLGMTTENKVVFESRKHALLQYAHGRPISEITKSTGIKRASLYRLIHRCTEINKEGQVVGFYALIKWKHIGNRVTKLDVHSLEKGSPGAFKALLTKYPALEATLRNMILKGLSPGSSKKNTNLTWNHIHEVFMSECTALNIKPPYYPFCSDSKGKYALKDWGRKLLKGKVTDNPYQSQSILNLAPPSECFQRVELDGHFVDINWVVQVPGLNGEGVIECKVPRLWLIALIECKSGAVLGYSISLGKNYNAGDVAEAVRKSMVPWEPRNLGISTISYKTGECLPNALIPELSYICFDELWLDNAKSHLSDAFLTVLEQTINSTPVFGPVGSPNVRPRVELLFDLLEEGAIHYLDCTTGSNPKDPRKGNVGKENLIISLDLLLDLIDLLIVRYNTGIAPGTTISRNEVLKRAIERERNVFRRIPESKRANLLKYTIYDKAKITYDRGTPVVRWKNARYYGPGLTKAYVGQEVIVMSPQDAREMEAILVGDGTSLGVLIVEKRWRATPHSIYTRAVAKRFTTNESFISYSADIALAVRLQLESEAKLKNKNNRNLARIYKEQHSRVQDSADNLSTYIDDTKAVEDGLYNENSREELDNTDGTSLLDDIDITIKKLHTVYK